MSNAAALNARIADVMCSFRRLGVPSTIAQVQTELSWRFLPVWETEQLVAKQVLRRVPNTPGVHCVDGRYEVRPSRDHRAPRQRARQRR